MPTASLLLLFSAVAPCPAPQAEFAAVARQDTSIDAKIRAAGDNVTKLMELAAACTSAGAEADARKVYRRVVELAPDHEEARKALGHRFYDQKWFESLAELTKYKRDEAARMKAKGLVRFKEEWVPEADLPFRAMAWTRNSAGKWVNPVIAAREKHDAERKAAGFQYRADDNSWVAPDDMPHWTALRWKCGDAWVELAAANEFHSKLENAWELRSEHFLVYTTCEWSAGNSARWYAEKVYPELVRLFGVAPQERIDFVVLNSLEQYNAAAGGAAPVLPDAEGFSSLHGAYFADVAFDYSLQPPQYVGCGVSFWNRSDEKLRGWGPYWVRWAAAQSFVEAIDPSWNAVSEWIAAGSTGPNANPAAFWAEKRIPRWLRYGAASYVERYMRDPDAAEGGNPWALREFAFGEIGRTGGLRKLDELFAFGLDLTKLESSSRMYHEAGLVVAFLLDGAPADTQLASAHETFRAALKAGEAKSIAAAAAALQKELGARDAAIRTFAGLR